MHASSNARCTRSVGRMARPAVSSLRSKVLSTTRSDRRGAAVVLRTRRELEGTLDRAELIELRDMRMHKSTRHATFNIAKLQRVLRAEVARTRCSSQTTHE